MITTHRNKNSNFQHSGNSRKLIHDKFPESLIEMDFMGTLKTPAPIEANTLLLMRLLYLPTIANKFGWTELKCTGQRKFACIY